MRKWIALLLALTMLCLCGCSMKDDDSGKPTEPLQTTAPVETTQPDMQLVELTLRVAEEGMWADTQAVDALLAEFNAYYPNIIIHVEHGDLTVQNGINPDVVLANTARFAQMDWAMEDLSDLWSNGLHGDVYESLENACKNTQGGFYAVPLAMNPYCMAVNVRMFEEAGALSYLNTVNHTWNTASFLKAVQAVYDYGTDTVGTIYCKDLQEDDLVRLLVTNLYDGNFVDRKTGAYNVSGGNMGRALTALAQQEGIRFDANTDAQGTRQAFLDGKTAFTLNWSAIEQAKNASNSNILFMHYPSSDSIPETWAEVYGLGVCNNGDPVKLAASRTFVAYMMGNADAVRATGCMSARASLKDIYAGTNLERTMSELNKLVSFLSHREPQGQYWDTARKEWVNLLQNIASSGENWQEALENGQKNLNSLFPELFPPETEASEPTEYVNPSGSK